MNKVAFFQPYIAKWRFDFLNRFYSETNYDTVILDGNFKSKKNPKSRSYGKTGDLPIKKVFSLPIILKVKGQQYPIYCSPFLLFRLIKERPEVVITEGEINFINNISIWLYTKLFNKKYIWWSLGKVRTRKKNIMNKLFDPLVNFLLSQSHRIVARNTYAKNYYVEVKGIDPKKIIVAPNSLDEVAITSEIESCHGAVPTYDGRVILYVGAINKEKRPYDLLEAFQEVQAKIPDARLVYVGDGLEKAALEARTKEFGLEDSVEFTGAVFEGVSKYFLAADLVVVPGLGGLVIHHAMVHGKPVISRPADGTEEDLIIDGYNGYIEREYDNQALAEKMIDVLSDPERTRQMGEKSKEIVDLKWNMSIMIERFAEAINQSL